MSSFSLPEMLLLTAIIGIVMWVFQGRGTTAYHTSSERLLSALRHDRLAFKPFRDPAILIAAAAILGWLLALALLIHLATQQ